MSMPLPSANCRGVRAEPAKINDLLVQSLASPLEPDVMLGNLVVVTSRRKKWVLSDILKSLNGHDIAKIA